MTADGWSEEVWCGECNLPLGQGTCQGCRDAENYTLMRERSAERLASQSKAINYDSQVVQIFCPEHVWHGEIGITRGLAGPAHCKVEFGGCLRKIPIGWLRDAEPGTC